MPNRFNCPDCGNSLILYRAHAVRKAYAVHPRTGQAIFRREDCTPTDNALGCQSCGFFTNEDEGLFTVNVDGDVEWREPVADQPPF